MADRSQEGHRRDLSVSNPAVLAARVGLARTHLARYPGSCVRGWMSGVVAEPRLLAHVPYAW